MFKNVSFFRISSEWPQTEAAVDEALIERRFEPCGSLSERSFGWEPPAAEHYGRLCRSVAGTDLIQLRTQSRLLPAAAINEAVEARLAEFRERTGDVPGRREQRRLKSETRDQLLPKALLRSERTRGLFLRSQGILAIDTVTPAKLERFTESLRSAFGRLEAVELAFKQPVEKLLRSMFLGEVPAGTVVARECRMQDPSDKRTNIRFADMDLADASVRRHVRDGMALTHLALEFDGVSSFVLDDRGRLTKFKLASSDDDADGRTDSEADPGADPLIQLDTRIVLLAETLRKFVAMLTKSLGKV